MIVDTSAVMAIVLREPAGKRLATMLVDAEHCAMSAATRVELAAVLARRFTAEDARRAEEILQQARIEIAPFDDAQASIAAHAYREFGQGTGHSARLNFGDTFSYALAKARDEPLLFVGNDFTHTDVRVALPT